MSSSPKKRRRRGGHVAVMLGWTFAWLGGTAAIAGYSIVRHAPALERLMLDDVRDAVAPLSDAPITVSVRDHVATLSGTVDGAAERDAVLAAAGKALGIRRVVDRLVVSAPVPSTVTGDAPDTDEPSGSEATADAGSGTTFAAAGAPELAPPTGEPSIDELPAEDEFEPDEALEAELEPAELPSEDLLPEEPEERAEAPRGRAEAETLSLEEGELAERPVGTPPPDDVAAADATPVAAIESVESTVEAPPPGDAVGSDAVPAEGNELAESPVEAPPSGDSVEPDVATPGAIELAELPVGTLPPDDAVEADAASGETIATGSATEKRPSATAPDAGAGSEAGLASGRAPTLRLDVVDRVLTMEGSLSRDDDAAALVLTAMDSFELDYVSNTLESEKDVAPASWLVPVSVLLPEMAALDDPGIEVSGRQVTLYGTAPDAATRGGILGLALEHLGDYSLVERIDVGGTGGNVAPGPTPADEPVPADEGTSVASSTDEADGDDPSAASDTASSPEDAASTADGTASDADAPDVFSPEDESSDVASPNDGTSEEGPAASDATVSDSAADDAPGGDSSDGGPADGTEPLRTALLVSPRAGDGRTEFAPLASPVAALRAALAALPAGRILFESGSATLTEESRATLDDVAEVLLAHPGVPVAIEGHTDGRGLREANLDLSQRRANAVRDHLVSRGVSYGRLTSYGYGEGVPIADNATPEGRAANRRIEFTF